MADSLLMSIGQVQFVRQVEPEPIWLSHPQMKSKLVAQHTRRRANRLTYAFNGRRRARLLATHRHGFSSRKRVCVVSRKGTGIQFKSQVPRPIKKESDRY